MKEKQSQPAAPRHTPTLQPKVQPNLLRRMNERRVLEFVQAAGQLSRAGLVRQTGISPPTVSKLVGSLIAAGLLEEGPAPGSMPGRPAKVLRLAQSGSRILSAVVDTHECCIAATGLHGQLQEELISRFPTPDGYEELLTTLVQHATKLMSASDKTTTLALGLSAPGLVDRRQQQVFFSANLHLLDGHYPARDLAQRLAVPTILLHDTDALCLGERTFGEARGMDDFVFIDATSGLGAAIMIGGQLMSGHNGLAGEIGHITVEPHGRRCGCGNFGCLETVATDEALATRISEKIGTTVDIDQVLQRVSSGDLNIDAEFQQTIEYLAIAVAAVANIFNPAAVMVQGRMFELRSDAFDQLLESVRKRALSPALADCSILRASVSKLQGAVAGTIHHLTSILGPKV